MTKGYWYLLITSNWSAGIPPKLRESLSGAGNWAKPRKARPHDHTQHHPLSTVSKFQLPDARTYHARGGCILPSISARGQHDRHGHAHTSRTRCPPPITRRPPGPTPCPRTTLRPRALRWSGCARTCAAAPPMAVQSPASSHKHRHAHALCTQRAHPAFTHRTRPQPTFIHRAQGTMHRPNPSTTADPRGSSLA